MSATTFTGTLLGESIRPDAAIDIPLTVTNVHRTAAGDPAAGQPELWTFIEFAVDGDRADELAGNLSRVLIEEGGWYCDFRSSEEVIVVFYDRVFRYPRGDRAARAKAEEHGRSMGIPESNLDWPE
jgi:hypothetical protein